MSANDGSVELMASVGLMADSAELVILLSAAGMVSHGPRWPIEQSPACCPIDLVVTSAAGRPAGSRLVIICVRRQLGVVCIAHDRRGELDSGIRGLINTRLRRRSMANRARADVSNSGPVDA